MGTQLFSNNSNYYIDVDATLVSQDQGAKTSYIYWRVNVVKTAGSGFASTTNQGNSGSASSNVGQLWANGNMAYNFQNGQNTGTFTIADGHFTVQHGSDGQGSYYVDGTLTLNLLGTASAGTGWRNLPSLARVPDAPTPLFVDQNTQTTLRYAFSGNYDGGAPIIEWQVGYGTDPNIIMWERWSDGLYTAVDLAPATTYYFWSRGRNSVGWGPWSSRWDGRTIAGARVKVDGNWKEAIPWVKVDGNWKLAQPWVKVDGNWKKTI